MPIFFFLSGMCFNFNKYNRLSEFLKEKFCKRIIPYFGFAFFGLIFCLIIPDWREQLFSIDMIKELLWYGQPEILHVGQIWFLIALFFAEFMFYLINKLFDKFDRNKWLKFTTYLFLVILGFCILQILKIFSIDRLPLKIDTAITAAVFIGIGYESNKSQLLSKFSKHKQFLIPILLVSGFYFGAIVNGNVNICNCAYNNMLFYYMSAICGIIAIYYIGDILKNCKLLQFYGRNSLFMFATHSVFLYLYAGLLSLFYNREIQIMKDIPLSLSILGSIIIFALLLFCAVAYNRIKIILKKRIIMNSNL